jgi:hypothetical protein
MAMNPERPP